MYLCTHCKNIGHNVSKCRQLHPRQNGKIDKEKLVKLDKGKLLQNIQKQIFYGWQEKENHAYMHQLMIDKNDWQEIIVVQTTTDEHLVIVNGQLETIVHKDPEIATIARIINDETIKIRYKAPQIKNDIGEQHQVDDDKDAFEKNQDAEVVHDMVQRMTCMSITLLMFLMILSMNKKIYRRRRLQYNHHIQF